MSKIPETIGRYVVDRLLGQGAMGAVFLGHDPQLDRKVAIKTVRELDQDDKHRQIFLERFRNEARAAARVSSPSIVAVYDVGDQEGVGPYLVLEYVPGTTLKHLVRSRGALPPAEVISIAGQIASALDVAHAAGILHRDVKPDNVLITDEGRAKLADFGVARVPDAALTREGQFLGTPCYAAPETLSAGRYSNRSDLFSFACVIYELCCAVRAFPGDDAISVAHAVIHDFPPPPSEAGDVDVPPAVDRVIAKGLSKAPEDRYENAAELAAALEAAYVDAGLVAPGETSRPLVRPRRSSAWGFTLVLGVLLAVGLGLVAAGGTFDFGSFGLAEADADAGIEAAVDAGAIASDRRRNRDAGAAVRDVVVDAGLAIASPEGPPDAGPPDTGVAEEQAPDAPPEMSRFEREQAAKDAIDRARARISVGDLDAARRELERARELDPESSDLEELEAALR